MRSQPHGFLLLATATLAAMPLLAGCSRLASAQKAPLPPLQYLGAWGVRGSDPGQLDLPASIATDVQGNVYIADSGSQFVDKFSRQGTPLLAFQDDRLKHPQSIAVDRGGAIYVSDPVRGSVFIFFPDGDRYREIHLNTKKNPENKLDVAVADDGAMSVLDVNAAKVFDFTPGFRLVRTWQPSAGLSGGGAGRPRSIEAGQADAFYLGGAASNAIQRYAQGKLAAEVGAAGAKIGEQFAVTNNYVFVMDADGRELQVWTVDGTPKAVVDLTPELGMTNRLAPPIAVSPAGELFIVDAPQARVLRYRINL
jgi:DNA-binding beta-propeller fold protein YncE